MSKETISVEKAIEIYKEKDNYSKEEQSIAKEILINYLRKLSKEYKISVCI